MGKNSGRSKTHSEKTGYRPTYNQFNSNRLTERHFLKSGQYSSLFLLLTRALAGLKTASAPIYIAKKRTQMQPHILMAIMSLTITALNISLKTVFYQ